MKQYSAYLRERLLGAIDAGLSQAKAACFIGVGISSIKRWRARQQQTVTVQAAPRPGRTRRIDRQAESARVVLVQAIPDATLVENYATWRRPPG